MGVLRFLLAVCVLFGHAHFDGRANWLPAGTAVEVFFVISGFYMQLILSNKYTFERVGPRWRRNFYLARYARLFPPYAAAAVLTIIASVVMGRGAGLNVPLLAIWHALLALPQSLDKAFLIGTLVFSNSFILFQDIGGVIAVRHGAVVFTLDRNATDIYVWSALALPQAWSLGVELLFYLLAPVLLKRGNKTLITAFLLALAIKIAAVAGIHNDLPYRMFPFVLVEFLGGALACRFRHRLTLDAGRYTAWVAYAFVVALVVMIPKSIGPAAMSFLSTGLAGIAAPTLFASTKASKLDERIGDLSYPFYLYHILVYSAVHFLFIRVLGVPWVLTTMIIAVLLTALASYLTVWIESKTTEPWRQSLARGPRKAPPPEVMQRDRSVPSEASAAQRR